MILHCTGGNINNKIIETKFVDLFKILYFKNRNEFEIVLLHLISYIYKLLNYSTSPPHASGS